MGLIAAGFVTAIVFFVVGALFRVLIGPVSLGPFNGQVAQAISASLPGLAIGYDQAAIQWSRAEQRVNLVILGARVLDDNQRIIAQAPKAEIDLAAVPFLRGKLEVQRISLVGVQLTLVRTKDGTLRLGLENGAAQNDVLQRIRDAISHAKGGTASLESFAVRDARLAFYDEPSGAFIVSPNANFQISTSDTTASAKPALQTTVDAAIEISGRPAHLLANFTLPQEQGPVTGDVSFTGLELTALGRNSRAFAFLTPFNLKADVTGSFVFDNGARLRYADLGIGASGAVNGLGSPMNVRSLKLVARYDGTTGQLLIDDASLEGDHARAHMTGRGQLDFDATNTLTQASLDIAADKIAVDMPAVMKQSVTLGRIDMSTVYTPSDQKIEIRKFQVSGGAMKAQLTGAVTLSNGTSPAISADGSIGQMAVRDFLRYWPLHVGQGAREWINDNISAGSIGPIALHTAIKSGALDQAALPDDQLNLSVPLSGATITYITGMSPMTDVKGTATLLGDTFKAAIESAHVGPVQMSDGAVAIPQLHLHGTYGTINARVTGSVSDILKLIDQKPLRYPSRFHIDPSTSRGQAVADLTVRVPMLRDVNTNNVAIQAKVATTQLGVTLGQHTKISNGTVNFDITNDKLHANGTVALGGGLLNVDWVEDFNTKSDITSNITARGLVDEATREALGIESNGLVSGPIMTTAQIQGHQGSLRRATMAMDLTPATIALDIANFHKPPGVPAAAQMTAIFGNDSSIKSETVALTGALSGHGVVTYAPNGDLLRLEIPDLRAGPNNDFAIIYSDTQAGGLDVTVHGRSGDGTALGHRTATSGSGAPQAPARAPFRISVRLDRLVLRDNVAVSNFSLDTTGAGDSPQTLALSGMLSKSARLTGAITPSGGSRKVAITAEDAGTLLRGLFGFDSMRGGVLNLNATLSPPAVSGKAPLDYMGTVDIKDFKVVNQPFLSRLFAAGSFGGILDLLRGEGITFDTMEVPFRAQNDAITIHDARAAGPALGITADGYIDRAANQIALKGSIAPVYGLNSVLGAIPLLGDVLVSKKGEGIIGVTYSATGNADQPDINVNPLSAFAPGILRRIFEGATPVAPQPKAPAPAPAQQQPPPH